jgi:cell division septation protein DedD
VWYEEGDMEKALADGEKAISLKPTDRRFQEFLAFVKTKMVPARDLKDDVKSTGADETDAAARFFYSLQVASFRRLHTVEEESKRLAEKGFYVWWKKVHLKDKGEWFRLYMGKKKSRVEAEDLGKKLKSDGIIDAFLVHKFRHTSRGNTE